MTKNTAEVIAAQLIEFVERERGRRDNYNRNLVGQGGQQVGDSHSPRLPLSVLLELERMIQHAPDVARSIDELLKKKMEEE